MTTSSIRRAWRILFRRRRCCEVPIMAYHDGAVIGGRVTGFLRVDDTYVEFEGTIYDPAAETEARAHLLATPEVEQQQAAIERVKVLADDMERRGCTSCSSATGGDALAEDIHRALDGGQ